MLAPADAEIVRRERALPGLRVLLDADALADLVQSQLRGSAVRSIKQVYLHYKPGNGCLGGYEICVDGQPVQIYVRAYSRFDEAKIEKHAALQQVGGPFSSGRFHVKKLALVLAVFPNDARLPVLQRLVNDERRRDLLHRVFRKKLDLSDSRIVALAYKPERRFVAALCDREQKRAVLKFYDEASFAPHKAKLFRSGETLRVAARLGRCKRHGIVAYEWLPGRLLRDELVQCRATPDDFVRIGMALAELHAQPIEPGSLREVHPADLAKRVEMLAWFVGCVFPSAARRAADLAQRLIQGLGAATHPLHPLHGDLNEKQVLLYGNHVGLVDFDESVFGDPAFDLGNFLAYSHYDHGESSARMPPHQVSEALLHGYLERGDFIEPDRLDLFLAMALLRIAPRGFRTRDPLWPQKLESALDRAEVLLGSKRPMRSAARKMIKG